VCVCVCVCEGVKEDHSIDRFGRFQGMLQIVAKRVRGEPARAELVLATLEGAIDRAAARLLKIDVPRPREASQAVLGEFKKALHKMKIGLDALQIASLAVNLYLLGRFPRLAPIVQDELLCSEWPGLGKGTKKSLSYAGLGEPAPPRTSTSSSSSSSSSSSYTEAPLYGAAGTDHLRECVVQALMAAERGEGLLAGEVGREEARTLRLRYTQDIHVKENLPCELKRWLEELFLEKRSTHTDEDGVASTQLELNWFKSRRAVRFNCINTLQVH